MNEFARLQYIYDDVPKKLYHCGWFRSWPLRSFKFCIQRGNLHYVIFEEESN